MPTDLEATLVAVIRRLGSIAASNPDLIADLRQLAQRYLKLTEPPAATEPGVAEQMVEVAAPEERPVEPVPRVLPPPRHEPLPTVPGVEVPMGWAKRVSVSNADLQLIMNR